MKNILKSVVTIGAVATMAVASTGAYFSSSVIATGNEINTGTLLVAVDSAQNDSYVGTWGNPNAYNVIRQNADGTTTQNGSFITWDNAAPGDTNSYYVGVRNNGTIPFKFRAGATGAWTAGPAFGVGSCPATPAAGNASLVSVTNVHQFASGTCESEFGCRNLRDALQTLGWTYTSGLSVGDFGPVTGYYYGQTDGSGIDNNTPALISENEFAIYRVDVALSNTADNCYQGATYMFDLGVEGYQETDPVF